MEESTSNGLSSGEAVLLGALASGVNAPTWAVLKITFMMLGICLVAMLSLAFISSDFIIVGHVILLVIIGAVLFVLLNGFLAQTGLVSVEQQIEEMAFLKSIKPTLLSVLFGFLLLRLALFCLQEAEARATWALKHELHLSPLSTLYRKSEKANVVRNLRIAMHSSSTLPFKCSGEVPFPLPVSEGKMRTGVQL